MNINNNLQSLYAAQQQKAAYNDYQAKTKKGEKVEENLFDTADKNGDGKVNSKDLTTINSEISKLTSTSKTPLLYDVDGDGKVTLTDLMEFDVNTDIDGDGKVSDSEKKFLEEQKNTLINQLKNQKDTVEYDVNGDGKVDANDLSSFLSLTARKGDFRNSTANDDKYLTSVANYLNKIAVKELVGSSSVSLANLAVAEQRLDTAQAVSTGDSKINYLSDKYKNNSDINNDGKVDNNDVTLIETVISSMKQQLGVSSESLNSVQSNYEAKLLAYEAAKDAEAAAKTAYSKASKANKAAALQAYKDAQAATKAAKAEYTAANKEYSTVKSYFTKAETLEEAENKEILNNYTAAVKAKAKELTAAEKAQTTAQTNYTKAEKALTDAKTKLTNLKNQAVKATGSKLNSLNKQIQTLENTTIPNLEKAKAEKLEALNKAKETVEAKKVALSGTKDINNSLETNDAKLKAALENLTDEEQLLIREQNIDITETFEDGSPMYILAKGKKDGQYHLYKFDSPTSDIASSVIRHSMGYTGASYNIIANGNGRVRLQSGSSTSADEFEIIIPKKIEKTIYETSTETVTLPAKKELTEVMDEITGFYNELLQENWNTAKKPDVNVLKSIQSTVVTDYYNDKLGKADIATTIANQLTEQGFNGQAILDAIAKNDAKGQKLESLINKLAGTLADTKPTTEEKIVTTEKKVTILGSETSNQKYSTTSPLSFDLNGDGVKTSETKVKFDIDGDGKLDVINDSADAVLVFDADGDGISGESGLEAFGNITDLDGDGKKDGFANGFDALKALAMKEGLIDGKSDNTLNAQDIAKLQEKYGLAMKAGYNGEAKSLTDLGITSINLGATNETQMTDNFDGKGNQIMTQEGSTFEINGKQQAYADIWHRTYDTAD